MLTDAACRRAACAADRAYSRFADAGGLYLEVSVAGTKAWRWKYRVAGVEKRLTLGRYPEVSLAAARVARDAARLTLRQGVDPAQRQQAERAAGVAQAVRPARQFEAIARRWHAGWRGSRSIKYADQVLTRLELYVFPDLGARDVGALRAADFVRCVKAIEAQGYGEVARRVFECCGRVMRYAAAEHDDVRNVCADVAPVDVFASRTERHHAFVPLDELPGLLRAMDAYPGAMLSRVALQLLALTFVRTSELIEVRLGELDLPNALWQIPAARMKARRPHVVPLARQAVAQFGLLIEHARVHGRIQRTGPGTVLFPNRSDPTRPMSDNTVLKAIETMGYKERMTGHGFRSIASTALNEMGWRHDVIEAQLAHIDPDRVRAAYNHAKYLPERRAMMQAWADHLDGARLLAEPIG